MSVPTKSFVSFVKPSETRNRSVSSKNVSIRVRYRKILSNRKRRKSLAIRRSLSILSDCCGSPMEFAPACECQLHGAREQNSNLDCQTANGILQLYILSTYAYQYQIHWDAATKVCHKESTHIILPNNLRIHDYCLVFIHNSGAKVLAYVEQENEIHH
jgi:hypothetical protein